MTTNTTPQAEQITGKTSLAPTFASMNREDLSAVVSSGNDIPVFGQCRPEQQAVLEQIVATTDRKNPNALELFGSDILNKSVGLSQAVIKESTANYRDDLYAPIKGCAAMLENPDFEEFGERMLRLMDKGTETVKRNKGETALIAGLTLTGNFYGALGVLGFTAAKEKYKTYKAEQNKEEIPFEVLEQRIRDAIGQSEQHFAELHRAEKRAPALLERIETMRQSNGEVYAGLTAYIAAGQEILRQMTEEDLPALQQKLAANWDFETQQDTNKIEEGIGNLNHQLKVLNQGRVCAVTTTLDLNVGKDAIKLAKRDIQSLQTSELPLHFQQLSTALTTLDSWKITKVTGDMRNHLDRVSQSTTAAARGAFKAAQEGQIDAPERIKKTIARIVDYRQFLEDNAVKQNEIIGNQRTLNAELQNQVTALLELQSKSPEEIRAQLANDNRLTSDGKVAPLKLGHNM
jgi:uncharacterized protein YaaN involved in tellurite resistance